MYTLDRFEENTAVLICDSGEIINLPRKDFKNRREGDVFKHIDGEFIFDTEETKRRREHNRALYKKLLDRKNAVNRLSD